MNPSISCWTMAALQLRRPRASLVVPQATPFHMYMTAHRITTMNPASCGWVFLLTGHVMPRNPAPTPTVDSVWSQPDEDRALLSIQAVVQLMTRIDTAGPKPSPPISPAALAAA